MSRSHTLPFVVKASRPAIEEFIKLREFPALFGGYILWAAPDKPTLQMPGPALGVWSTRIASRFRRVLRQRGAILQREPYPGPDQAITRIHQGYQSLRDIIDELGGSK